MNLNPLNQIELYGLNNDIKYLIKLFHKKKLPNKILLTGRKGIGKCTLAYHLVNYILSQSEEYEYDAKRFSINRNNKSFKLISNGTNPNFNLIDLNNDKKNIEIDQIRNLIIKMNKSSFNTKPRFVLIDNTEFLNKNSINALLKTLEEPNENIYFILINNQKKLLNTLTSRCINFNLSLSNAKSIEVINKLLDDDVFKFINKDFLDYYFSPGNIYNLINFSKNNQLELKEINLKVFLQIIISEKYYKKENSLRYLFYDFFEIFLKKTAKIIDIDYYNQFIRKIYDMKKYNLDEETFFLEFNNKILNG